MPAPRSVRGVGIVGSDAQVVHLADTHVKLAEKRAQELAARSSPEEDNQDA